MPATRSAEPAPIDLPGTALLALAVLTLLVPLSEGRMLGWPAWIWALLALFPPAAAALTLVERRLERTGGHPIVPPSLLRLQGMRRGLVIAVPFFAGFAAFMFSSAITLQQGLHFSALRSGLTLVPMAVAFLAASLSTAALITRFGRRVLSVGAVVQGIGLSGLAWTLVETWPHVTPLTLAPAMIVAGFGQGLVLSPLFGFVLAGVPADRAGVGSGILTTTQQAALALGVASLGSLFLAQASSLGMRDAFVLVLTLQVGVAAVVAVAARSLIQAAPAPRLVPSVRVGEPAAEGETAA